MSNTYKTGLAAAIAASMALVALALPCPNQGFVQGTTPCATVDHCFNHSSYDTCQGKTAYNDPALMPNTGTVSGMYINKISQSVLPDRDMLLAERLLLCNSGQRRRHP